MLTSVRKSSSRLHGGSAAPSCQPRFRWPSTGVAIILGIVIYGLVYAAVRTTGRSPQGRLTIDTGSRIANGLYAPLIYLEQVVRDRPDTRTSVSFEDVLQEARSTERPVLIALGTKTCLPCRQLERFLHDQQAIISRYFIVLKASIDDSATPGERIRAEYRKLSGTDGYTEYFPWIAFVDGNGTLLLTGDDHSEGLIGIPHGGPQDRAWFLEMLRRANPKITDAELARLDAAAEAYHRLLWRDVPAKPPATGLTNGH